MTNDYRQRRIPGLAAVRRAAMAVAVALSLVSMLSQTGSSLAQTNEVQVGFTADAPELTVGDSVTLTLQVTHPADVQVILPRVPGTWGPFEVRSQSPVETTRNDDGTETVSQKIEVTLFSPGTFETPELSVTVRDQSGNVVEQIAPPVSLTVRSVLSEDDVELRDIRPQAGLSAPPIWPWVVAVLAVAVLIGGATYLWMRRRRSALPETFVYRDTRSPYQIVRDELERIEGLDLPVLGRFKEHYTLVADCVRTYLEGAHGVPAIDQTTDEVRLALRGTSIDRRHSSGLIDLFSDCDLVKFAKYVPERDTARNATIEARRLVDVTMPTPEVTEDGSAGEAVPAVQA